MKTSNQHPIYFLNIGDKVMKKSGKPFKSGNKINTIKEFCENPYNNNYAVKFEEDDSIVSYDLLKIANN